MFLPIPRARPGRHCSLPYILGTILPFILIISSLTAFTILSVRYLYIPRPLQRDAPQVIETSTLVMRQVACALPRSGHYCIYQRYIYYILLIATIITTIVFGEKHALLLAGGAAATVMLYSGVAAVHQRFIFGYGLQTQKYSTCEYFPLDGTNDTLPVCYGFDDHDRDTACIIVGTALLAILPMAMWSSVFQKAAARPLLVLWMLLMASSHVFCAVSKTETTVHYQICRAGQTEDLPGLGYQATDLNDAFRTTYSEMLSNTSSSLANGISKCLYSCFVPHGYNLRAGRDIAVLDNMRPALNQTPSLSTRRLGVAFWAIYLVFLVLALVEQLHSSKSSHGPGSWRPLDFILKPMHRQHPWLAEPINTKQSWRKFREENPRNLACLRLLIHVLVHFPRFLSAVMFTGYVVFLEWTHWDAPESEPFSAVGQFGAVVVLLLVVLGTIYSKLTEHPEEAKETVPDDGHVELQACDNVKST